MTYLEIARERIRERLPDNREAEVSELGTRGGGGNIPNVIRNRRMKDLASGRRA
jgi:hypothetical protein